MIVVYIHYIFFPSLQFNSRKIALCCLIESGRFFLALSSWGAATNVVIVVDVGGSLCCNTSANQWNRD